MTLRWLLLPIVAAAFGGLLIVGQLHTRDIGLNTSGPSPQEQGAYLGWARTEAPELWAASDEQLVRAGAGICVALDRIPDRAVTPQPVDGLTGPEMHAITDAATRHLCPSQRSKVAGYLRDTR